MTRRVSLPGASELFFRSTSTPSRSGTGNGSSASSAPETAGTVAASRRGSPRKKHDAKITVYLSQDELLALEHARLALRGDYDLAVDRGRLVREAIAVLLADFETSGESSVLVRRLQDSEEESAPR